MKDFLIVILGLFLIWFVLGVMRKRFYYGEVEAVLKSRGYLPDSFVLLMGLKEYWAALEESRKRGMKSYETADSLIRYFYERTNSTTD